MAQEIGVMDLIRAQEMRIVFAQAAAPDMSSRG
jgi:hypothetical protein